MDYYNYLRYLDPDSLRVLWVEAVKRGDTFLLNGFQVNIIHNTLKQLRLKYKGQTYTFKKYGHIIESTGRCWGFLRDIEGILNCDLINEYNRFHTVSDVFNLSIKTIEDMMNTVEMSI